MATVSYQVDENSQLTRRMVVCALVAANWAVGVIVQHYFAGVIRGTIYTPESKWGPMSFMRLTHEAFRDIMPQLISCASPSPLGFKCQQCMSFVIALSSTESCRM